MKNRKALALIMVAAMVLSSFSMAFAQETTAETATTSAQKFSDTVGHWAFQAIETWAGYDVLNGSDGKFRPDAPITRAEMATVLDNMMNYQTAAKNTFSDVPASAWYADAVLKANAAGILNGDGMGHATPTANITREQAALMLARAFAVPEGTKAGTKFTDADTISAWAAPQVYGMEKAGYISGFEGKFNPKNNITRAEVVTIINNAVKAYYTKAGTYTENVEGLAIVKVADVIIKDAVIAGNVIIAEGVADGNVTFDGKATVKGELVVRGGGVNSIVIKGNASIQSIVVAKIDGKVRIFADGVVIGEVEANEGVILEGNFTNVTVAEGAEIVVKGNVAKLDLAKDSAADIQSGTVSTLNIPAGATANIASSATVKTANVTGVAEIKGTGKIETANISGEGAKLAQTPTKINLQPGSTANVGGKDVGDTGGAGGGGGGGGGTGGGDNGPAAAPSLTSLEITPLIAGTGEQGSPYTISSSVDANTATIKIIIGNIEADRTYRAEVSIKNQSGAERATASASTMGSYINTLLNNKTLQLADLDRALDLLGDESSSVGTDLVSIFNQMREGEIYTLSVKITPVGFNDKSTTIVKYLVKQVN